MKDFAGVAAIAVVLSLSAVTYGQASSGTTAASTDSTAQTRNLSEPALQRITQEVRHQLVMLPYYSVFDNLAYKVSPDGTVTLMGQVLDPTLKPDAERVVKKVEGVENVVNNIEVLPTSPNDDRIRRAVYRAIYGNDVLAPYSLRAVPPIHIIVKNGNVTLTGVVARQMDKQIAETQAKSVPGVFGVTDDLQVENRKG
ncbi:MAG TPA: BON domain-containing protein [Terriglobales bacterium]|nr:BON domain-containing protein [Terriglobales bacterium]